MSLSAYRIYFLGIEVYKSKIDKNPNYINKLFQSRNIPYDLRDRNKYDQSIFNTIKYGFKSFSYYGASLWNKLPVSIKESDSLYIFKNKLKDWCRTDACKKLEICWNVWWSHWGCHYCLCDHYADQFWVLHVHLIRGMILPNVFCHDLIPLSCWALP